MPVLRSLVRHWRPGRPHAAGIAPWRLRAFISWTGTPVRNPLRTLGGSVAFTLCAAIAWSMPVAAAPPLDAGQARDIASDAYVYAYPIVLMDVARRVQTNVQAPDTAFGGGAPMNRFTYMSRAADPLLHGLPYPDVDT